MAPCPAHDDRKPSLSLGDASDGKALVHCHAGCDQRTVIAALGDLGLWSPSREQLATDFAKPKRQVARGRLKGCRSYQSRPRAVARGNTRCRDSSRDLSQVSWPLP